MDGSSLLFALIGAVVGGLAAWWITRLLADGAGALAERLAARERETQNSAPSARP
jgi:hypothetical protein